MSNERRGFMFSRAYYYTWLVIFIGNLFVINWAQSTLSVDDVSWVTLFAQCAQSLNGVLMLISIADCLKRIQEEGV